MFRPHFARLTGDSSADRNDAVCRVSRSFSDACSSHDPSLSESRLRWSDAEFSDFSNQPFASHGHSSLNCVLFPTGYDQRYDLLDRLEVFTGRYQGVQLVSDPTTDAKLVSLSDSSKIVFQPATVFPSACGGFPTDFCFRVIFKLRERVQKAFYVLTLTNRRSSVVVLGISLQTDRVVLEYQAKGSMKTREVSFQVNTDQLADGAWHRLQICATDVQAKLNLDCSLPGLSQPLTQRAEVDLTGSGFVGRKTGLGGKRRQSSFQVRNCRCNLYSIVNSDYRSTGNLS